MILTGRRIGLLVGLPRLNLRSRWIVLGDVVGGVYVERGNCGSPDGFRVYWAGDVDTFQPWEFVRWDEVKWAIERRLALAGLRLMQNAECRMQNGEWPLVVEVARAVDRRWKRHRRKIVNKFQVARMVEEETTNEHEFTRIEYADLRGQDF